ncbi:hypothetical protein [Arthrobacter pigmenti]
MPGVLACSHALENLHVDSLVDEVDQDFESLDHRLRERTGLGDDVHVIVADRVQGGEGFWALTRRRRVAFSSMTQQVGSSASRWT